MQNKKPVASFWFRLLTTVLTIFGSTLVLLAALSAGDLFTTSLPTVLVKELNLPLIFITIIVYVRLIALIAGALLTGFFGGRFGWRKAALIGLALLSFSVGVSGAMTAFAGLAVTSFFVGLGEGILLTAVILQLLVDVGSRRLLASAASVYFAMRLLSTLASGLGPLLTLQAGSGSTFLIAGGASLGVGLAGMGLIFLALLARRSRAWREEWLGQAETGPQRTGTVFVLIAVFLTAWAGLTTTWISGYASKNLGMTGSEIGLMFGAIMAAVLFSALACFAAGGLADLCDWLTGRVLHRGFGRLAVFGLGIILSCAGFGILLAAKDAKALTAGMIVFNLGLAVEGPPLLALLVSRAPLKLWGVAVGLFIAVSALGDVGAVVNGASVRLIGYGGPWIIGIVISLAALVLVILSTRFDRAAPETAAD